MRHIKNFAKKLSAVALWGLLALAPFLVRAASQYYDFPVQLQFKLTNTPPSSSGFPVYSASSLENSGTQPRFAFDGNSATRWSSSYSDPQWLMINYGGTRTLSQVTLQWESDYARKYRLQVSNNASSWTDVYISSTGAGGTETITLKPVIAQYLRLYATQRATPFSYAVAEMRVSTITATAPPPPPPPVPLPIISFSASLPSITLGQSTLLVWSIANAANVSISPGIGSVSASGTRLVNPSATTLYTLSANNSAGMVTAGVQVTVNQPPQPPGLPTGPSLTVTPGREFSANSYVHKPLAANAPIDEKSAVYVANLQSQIARYYGVASVNITQYTPAVFIVGANQPTVRVKAWDRSNPNWSFAPLQAKWDNVPLPSNFRAASGTDEEAVVYQPSTGKMWEFWLMEKTGGTVINSAGQAVSEWGARWGGRLDNIATNPGYFLTEGGDWNTIGGTKYGTTATSLAFLGGLLTIEEQQRGVIDHVVGLALPEVQAYPRWSYPANRCDGQINSSDAIAEGTIFRLPADLNLDQMSMDPYARMIAKAVQKHGMVVWDRAGAVTFRAENPADHYTQDPYTKAGGILNCPGGISQPVCWADSNGRLKGFPWDKLQVLKMQWNQ